MLASSGLPIVTVIIPNYNHAQYLSRRIESVLQQTVRELEVLILDDCSPDNSREVIEHYARLDARIRTVYNEQNSGSTFKQWNKGLALARSKYVWIAESDDYADPTMLETLLARLDANPALGLAYCDSWIVDEHNITIRQCTYLEDEPDTLLWAKDFEIDGIHLIRKYMSYENIIPNASGVVMRRDVVAMVGPAPENYRMLGDWLFWAKILAVSQVAYVAQPLNYFRQHTNNVRSSVRTNGVGLLEETFMLKAMQQYGPPNAHFYGRKVDYILRTWFNSLIYHQVPREMYRTMEQNMCEVDPHFRQLFRTEWLKFLVRNKCSGLRQLVGEGVLYPLLRRVKGNTARRS
ncbi:glycosyl transferase family 2 [Hymenobacter roseosalivarius DSM 11622]|uniref:Glycosyl transferase family 2 n=1 Tax=Hymenobacter roseosalivarius DSM 11622 TaxID=645990 RepID=A0A1W1V933_9BACT|nr:glycosyltransferase [Hymenobacter roseosalivarius]SMB89494.1 glycosyl transferase family 2 [Hymenobacter roseosalivarius DSM 11622]